MGFRVQRIHGGISYKRLQGWREPSVEPALDRRCNAEPSPDYDHLGDLTIPILPGKAQG
jgi:hypothetical protein